MAPPVTPPPTRRSPAGQGASNPRQTIQDALFTPSASNQKTKAKQKSLFTFGHATPQDSLFVFGQTSRTDGTETDGAERPSSPWEDLGARASPSAHTPPATTARRSFSSNNSAASVPSRASSTSPFPFPSPVFSFSPPSAGAQSPWSRSPSLRPRSSSRLSQRTATPPVRSHGFEFTAPQIRLSSPEGLVLGQTRQPSQTVDSDDASTSIIFGQSAPPRRLSSPRRLASSRQSASPRQASYRPKDVKDKSLEEFSELFGSMNFHQDEQSKRVSISQASEVLESIEVPTHQLEALALSPTPSIRSLDVPYDILGQEAPLTSSTLPEDLQNALDRGTDRANAIADVLIGQADPAAQDNRKKAQELGKFKPTAMTTIAVLGDSGNGKSSLINALLHLRGIAKVGDVGSACTSVVTEYHQKLPCHTAPIHIEVEYLPLSKRNEVITDLLDSFRRFYSPIVQSNETSAEEFRKFEMKSAQAWDALQAAFGHHKELSKQLLEATSEAERQRANELLYTWSAEMREPEGSDNGLWRGTAANAKACAAHTRVFTSDKFWPFTKVIRIYIDAYVLKSGIVLADLPGLKDTNLARVRVTEDYLVKCRHIFVVADIVRAITDASVKASVFSVLRRHIPLEWSEAGAKSTDITIVCTKTDSIDIDDARPDLGNSDFCAKVKELDEQIEETETSGETHLTEELERRRKMLFIEERNTLVRNKLQNAYADVVPDKQLRIFCVSNRMYNINVPKGNTELVQASEIPALRAYCTSITTDIRVQEARNFLHSALPILLNSAELWVKTMAAKLDETQTSLFTGGEEEVLGVVDKMSKRATMACNRLFRDVQSHVNEEIIEVSEKRHYEWHSAAQSHALRWNTWHWTQFNAWCINDGHHQTPNCEREDWNANIILQMRADLKSHWESVLGQTSKTFEGLRKTIEELLNGIKSTLADFAQDEIRETLIDQVNSTARDGRFKLGQAQTKLLESLQLIQRCSSESNFTSYILTQMIQTYRDASGELGTGKAARQRAIVRNRLSDNRLFATMTGQLGDEIAKTLKTSSEEVNTAMCDVLGQLKADIEMMATANDGGWLKTNDKEVEEVVEEKRTMAKLAAKLEAMKQDVRELEAAW